MYPETGIIIIQIISNLLSNAAKFTPKGEIHFGYREKEDFMEFYVKDSGIGIPAERVATIFQRFGKINDFCTRYRTRINSLQNASRKKWEDVYGCVPKKEKGSRFYFTPASDSSIRTTE